MWESIRSDPGLTLAGYAGLFADPGAQAAIRGSLIVTGLSAAVAVPLSLLLAWIITSTDAPGVRRLSNLPLLSLAIPPLVGAVGWLVLLAPGPGMVNVAIRPLLGMPQDSQGPFNANSLPVLVGVMAMSLVPYVYGTCASAFTRMDAELVAAAKIAGATSLQIARHIVLPVLRPAIVAGSLLAVVEGASSVAVPLILAPGSGVNVIPILIYTEILHQGATNASLALAVMLCSFSMLGTLFYLRSLGRASFATVGGQGLRWRRATLGRWRMLASGFVAAFILVGVMLPLSGVIYVSLVQYWSADLFREPLSFSAYVDVWKRREAALGLWNSLWLGAVSATAVVILSLVIAHQAIRRRSVLARAVSFVTGVSLGIPGVVLGVAVLTSLARDPFPLYGTAMILIVAYVIHMLPIGVRNTEAGLRQIGQVLEEAAEVCGDVSRWILVRVTAPLLRGAMIATWVIAFIILYRDLSVSLFLYTPRTVVSSITFLLIFQDISLPEVAAYSMIVSALSVLATVAIIRTGRDALAAHTG